jgi:hypothetical protein
MNCQKFESVVGELARGQIMEVEVRGEALAHSAECLSCSSRLGNEEMLTRGLRSLASEMDSLEVPASIEARLLSAFRQPKVVVPLHAARDHRRYWVAAVAALLLIVFSVVAVRLRSAQTPKQQFLGKQDSPKDQPVEPNKSVPAPTVVQNAPKTPQPNQRPRRHIAGSQLQARATSARNKNNNEVANHASNEVATEFMPLGYLNVAALQDGGQIVRVELPRTTLASFGLPVNMDRYNEKVKADILLGVDGMAHAIRFVQEKRLQ